MKYIDGDYIPLNWEFGHTEAFYIRGHVEPEEALEILRNEADADVYYVLDEPVHKYAHWSMQPTENGNGHILQTHNSGGKGRFKVTEVNIVRTRTDYEIDAILSNTKLEAI